MKQRFTIDEMHWLASRLEGAPEAKEMRDAAEALRWCTRVIEAAEKVVRDEASILGSARRRVADRR